jgi:hypothetical protein
MSMLARFMIGCSQRRASPTTIRRRFPQEKRGSQTFVRASLPNLLELANAIDLKIPLDKANKGAGDVGRLLCSKDVGHTEDDWLLGPFSICRSAS